MKRTKNKKLLLYKANLGTAYTASRKTMNDKEYLVVPVIMMVEGVHNGSHGPLLHTAEELGKIPASWNGRPVVIDHPKDPQGNYISANIPKVLERSSVGFVFNTAFQDGKLKAEAWIDPNKLQQVNEDLYEKINSGEIVEVSVGVFSDEVEQEGDWNGEHYVGIATNHRPDHLALLPEAVGACSVADGCGIRVNEQSLVKNPLPCTEMKRLNERGYFPVRIPVQVNATKTGYLEQVEQLRSLLYAQDNDTTVYYLMEVYPGYIIYQKDEKNIGTTYWKQSYTIENNAIKLTGEPVQVDRIIQYKPIVTQSSISTNLKKGELKMKEKEKLVNDLIANEATQFTEKEKEWLMGLDEAQLKMLTPVVQKKAAEPKKVDTTGKNEPPKEPVQVNITKEQAYKALGITNPNEFEEQMRFGLSMYKAQRDAAIDAIMAHAENVWKKEELQAMPFETLQKLHKSINVNKVSGGTDFTLFGGKVTEPVVNKEPEVEPMPLIGYSFEQPKEK